MKYGHRGGNHPVKDLATGTWFIFHLRTMDTWLMRKPLSKKGIAKPAFVNVNDGTNEGMAYEG